MKGPGLRTDLDVRRVWRCPKCGRTTRTAAPVVSQRCGCSDQGQWMRLEPPVKREPFRAPPREPIPDDDDLAAAQAAGSSTAVESAPPAAVADQPQAESPPGPELLAAVEPAPEASAPPVIDAPAPDSESAEGGAAPAPPTEEFGAGVDESSADKAQ